MPWFQACTKYQVRLNRPDRMAELARKCFYVARAECGPTQLNIPRDYFYGDIECEIYKTSEVSRGPGAEVEVERPVFDQNFQEIDHVIGVQLTGILRH